MWQQDLLIVLKTQSAISCKKEDTNMSFCSKCGTPLDGGEMFCGNCGQPIEGSAPKANSIDVKKSFINYFKHPVSTIKNLVYSLDLKFTAIICTIVVLLTAYIPFKPIKSLASIVTSGMNIVSGGSGSVIQSKINSLYFTFLAFAILFYVLGAALVLVYASIRGKKESFMRTLNLFVLCSIPAVLALALSALIFGLNSFSVILTIFGFALSGILLYSQFKEVLSLTDMDSFIAFVVVNALSYGITFYLVYSSIKTKLDVLNNFF